jgi:aspartate aminotransferase
MAAAAPALAQRLKEVEVAASVVMTNKARALAAAGHRVISLAVGEPDFETPAHAIEAAHRAALAGDTHYPPQDGTPALKAAVQRKFRRDNGLDYALDEIMIANGGKQIIMNAFLATIDAGDEVVIPAPYWISYADQAKLAGARPVFVPCPQNNGFKLRAEDLDAAITPRTKWLVLNSPNNPSGAALSAEELRAIGAVLARHPQVWVLSDDMYEHMVYGDFAFSTLAQVCPELKDRVLTVNGASKTYAMTGWRVGFCGGPRHLIKAMVNMQGQLTSGVCTVAQAAAGCRSGWAAGPRARPRRDLSRAARSRGRGAEPRPRHRLPPPGGRVLRLSQHCGLHRPHLGGRAAHRHRSRLRPRPARGAACRRRPWRGLWHEPSFPSVLCHLDGAAP